MSDILRRLASGKIDLDMLTDHCTCGSPARVVRDGDTDSFKVACSDCDNETALYRNKYTAAIAWNRQVRKMKGEVKK